ncbi:MAG TPA: MarR family transcriptional regulator [Gaiellales bacterium]|nr:MarR family transcriptional regulator [Gaiellales bacterium]
MAQTSSSDFTNALGPPLIGALLRMPVDHVRRHMLEGLHARGFDDIDQAHLAIVQYPGPQGLRPSDLAARLRMSKQAVNYLLGQLEGLGYLERVADPDDQRSRRIALTQRGTDAAHAIRDLVGELERDWEARLGRRRFAQLRALLVDLNDELAAQP